MHGEAARRGVPLAELALYERFSPDVLEFIVEINGRKVWTKKIYVQLGTRH